MQRKGEEKETPFLRLPHFIGEYLLISDLEKRQIKVILLICRLTYGFHQEWAEIRHSDFRAIGITPNHIKKVLAELVEAGIIISNKETHEYKINEPFFLLHDGSFGKHKRILNQLKGKQLERIFPTDGCEKLPITDSKEFPLREAALPLNGNRARHDVASVKETRKEIDKDTLKESPTQNNGQVFSSGTVNPYMFLPQTPAEEAAKKAWALLSPENTKTFSTIFLPAARQNHLSARQIEFAMGDAQNQIVEDKSLAFQELVEEIVRGER